MAVQLEKRQRSCADSVCYLGVDVNGGVCVCVDGRCLGALTVMYSRLRNDLSLIYPLYRWRDGRAVSGRVDVRDRFLIYP